LSSRGKKLATEKNGTGRGPFWFGFSQKLAKKTLDILFNWRRQQIRKHSPSRGPKAYRRLVWCSSLGARGEGGVGGRREKRKKRSIKTNDDGKRKFHYLRCLKSTEHIVFSFFCFAASRPRF